MKKILLITLTIMFLSSVVWGDQFSDSDIKHASIGSVIHRSIKTTFPSSIIEQHIREYSYLGCDNKCVIVTLKTKLTKTDTKGKVRDKVQNISSDTFYLPLTSDRKAYLPIKYTEGDGRSVRRKLVLTVDKIGDIDITDPDRKAIPPVNLNQ